ncbi:MAG TPA: ABC transporter substrate-binding protein [Rhodoglobus sp.]|nr:ABC transporter substrate-binding protein [Rhodoglobus sp.]
MGSSEGQFSGERGEISRRALLGGALGLGAAFGLGGLLAGCSTGGTPSSSASGGPAIGSSALPGGTPVRGGVLTLGVLTGGNEENLFPGLAIPNPDTARDYALYNLLFYPNDGEALYPLQPGLALSAEPNRDATVWTLKLRDGVTWHDGKAFTSADVVYNIKALWSDPTQNYASSYLVGLVKFAGVKAVDKLTVEIPLEVPSAQFPTIFAWFNFGVLQEGATPASIARKPIGTGPFTFESFTPGQKSVFNRNDNYWEDSKPYVDQLVVNSSFTDNNALLNALLGGQVNLMAAPAFSQVTQQVSAGQVQILRSAGASSTHAFSMRVDEGPFADPRVRKAMKLMTNRQQLVDGALAGLGVVGNDLQIPNVEYFASDLKPTYDVEQAKKLFQEAGVLGQTFELPTANVLPGMVEAATIWSEQAKAAGINIKVKTLQAGDYFTEAGGAYVRPFAQQAMQPIPSLTGVYRSLLQVGAPYWDTHWGAQKPGGAAANDLILAAEAELDSAKAADLWGQVQKQQFDDGGYVVWGAVPYIDFAAKNVRGLKASAAFNFNNWRFQDGWLAS